MSPDFERLLADSLQTLEATLKKAQAEMKTDARGGAITALQGVIGFIETIPWFESQNLTLPLITLVADLHDLGSGRVGKIVARRKALELDHRPPDASFRNVIKAYAIFAVDELCDHGSSVDDACKFVAAQLEHAQVPIGGRAGTQSWKTVRTWRSEVSRRGENDQLRHTLEALRSEGHFAPNMPIETLKTALAELLRERLPQLQAGLG